MNPESLAILVANNGPAFLRAVVEAFGGPDKVRAMLDAEYAAVDAAIDALEDRKFEP